MKAYGLKIKDKQTCKYGCCIRKKNRKYIFYIRRARKFARQQNIKETLIDS